MAAMKIMIQGTMSNSGKSFLAAALCRIFRQDGYRTAPFKSQNMALNSYITQEGLEIGRAQAMQAEAAKILPTVDMNPILLKPTSHMGSQVILRGEVAGNWKAMDYYRRKPEFIPLIQESFARLEEQYEVIVLEGAGSPAEINLQENDIVNMGMARLAGAPVLLVGDIDRGGVFASLYGTVMLLEPEERARIKGLVINKFRGDPKILEPGLRMIEGLLGIPVVGVIPLEEIDLEDEDSLSGRLGRGGERPPTADKIGGVLDVAVIRLPHISNFTDFNPLERIPQIHLRYVERAELLGKPDLLILPGTKNTMADLAWLRETGLEEKIQALAAEKIRIIGICGGYQMLGEWLRDPAGAEGPAGGCMPGMGLLPAETVFSEKKRRTRITGVLTEKSRMFPGCVGGSFSGYEIHMGDTNFVRDFLEKEESGEEPKKMRGRKAWEEPEGQGKERPGARMTVGLADRRQDGMESGDGRIFGSYLHGLFENQELTAGLIRGLTEDKTSIKDKKSAENKESEKDKKILPQQISEHSSGSSVIGIKAPENHQPQIQSEDSWEKYKEQQYDKLADLVRNSLDMEQIYRILKESAFADVKSGESHSRSEDHRQDELLPAGGSFDAEE